MNSELQKLKEKLDGMMKEGSPASEEALELSREIDLLILEYYRDNCIRASNNCDIAGGFV